MKQKIEEIIWSLILIFGFLIMVAYVFQIVGKWWVVGSIAMTTGLLLYVLWFDRD